MTDATQTQATEKLYAGKFKTVEELENGYKSSASVFDENANLKKKIEEHTKVPDEYLNPEGVTLNDSHIAEVKKMAKNSALTQTQYDKLLRETNSRIQNNLESFEAAKKEIGADNLNLIQDFVKKQYGEKVGSALMQNVITNKELREEVLAERQKALNTSAPGMNRAGGATSYTVTKKDVMAAREEMLKVRGKERVEAQKHYIAMQHQYAHRNKD